MDSTGPTKSEAFLKKEKGEFKVRSLPDVLPQEKKVDVCGTVQVQSFGLFRVDQPVKEVIVTNE